MKLVASAVIISVGIVTFAALDNWDDLTRPANVVPLEGGNVKLGEVFYETAGQSLTVEDPSDGSVLFSVETASYDLASRVESEVQDQVDIANRDTPEEDQITLETGAFVDPVRLRYRGWVRYRAEHDSNFQLTINQVSEAFEGNELTLMDFVRNVAQLEQTTRPQIESAFLLGQ